MAKGIYGFKIGMTQVFGSAGQVIPVTVIDIKDNVVLQQKTIEKDGYLATQVGIKETRVKLSNKPLLGHFAKSGQTTPFQYVREFRFEHATTNPLLQIPLGQAIDLGSFVEGDVVDVTAVSKGKGTEGNITRHNQSRGPMAHGSRYHRAPGSMGPIKGKEKGKKLPGHMGLDRVTIQNLEIVKVDLQEKILLVKGAVPGPNRGLVLVRSAVKKEIRG
jgi:large subunit ribosomal protein L3